MASSSPVLLLLLSLLLGAVDALPPPRVSFLLDSPDRPLVHFSLPGLSDASTLLLSDDGSTLYVGARDAVLSLDVSRSDVINLRKQVAWSPSEEERASCRSKVKNPQVDCPNFVHVVQKLNSTHLYACGSYAYSPQQAFIDIEHLSVVHQEEARGRCPFSPFKRSSAVVVDQELFVATTTDFRGEKPQISRFLSKDGRPDVTLDSPITLLNDPTFVGSSLDPAGHKLYFFFTEVGKEFSFLDELRIPRVAQVCKDDVGGERILQKKWTSFAKSALLCQPPGQPPFNKLEDVFALRPPEGADSSETLFYGVFTSQWSRQPESAVCAFRLRRVQEVFAGNFRTLEKERYQQKPPPSRRYLGKCGLSNSSDSDLSEVKKNFLTSQSVSPVGQPVVSSKHKYRRVAAMRTRAADGRPYDVLFLLTESGFLHKVALLGQGPRVVEEIQVCREPQLAKSLVLSPSKGVLYVGTSAGVTAVPAARCRSYSSCGRCVLARDPQCGWSRSSRTCSRVEAGHEGLVQNLEGSGVGDECQQAEPILEDREVLVQLNEAVKLRCPKPSNMASLSWSSAHAAVLPEKLFIQAADGSLSFLAAAGTFGSYRCEAEEAGVREPVARYAVRQAAGPRHLSTANNGAATGSPEDVLEDIGTEEPAAVQDSDRPEDETTREDASEPGQNLTAAPEERVSSSAREAVPTSRKDSRSQPEPGQDAPGGRSYHSELVAVSLLLAACVLILAVGSARIWRQRRTGAGARPPPALEDGSRTNTESTEVCALSTLQGAEPDQTVIQ